MVPTLIAVINSNVDVVGSGKIQSESRKLSPPASIEIPSTIAETPAKNRRLYTETLAAPIATVDPVAVKLNSGMSVPSPRPRMVIPATSASHPLAAAIVSACPGITIIKSPLFAVHLPIA